MIDILDKHYYIGMVTSIGAGILPWCIKLMPLLQVLSLVIGITLGIVTIVIKIDGWIMRRHERKEQQKFNKDNSDE